MPSCGSMFTSSISHWQVKTMPYMCFSKASVPCNDNTMKRPPDLRTRFISAKYWRTVARPLQQQSWWRRESSEHTTTIEPRIHAHKPYPHNRQSNKDLSNTTSNFPSSKDVYMHHSHEYHCGDAQCKGWIFQQQTTTPRTRPSLKTAFPGDIPDDLSFG